MREASCKALMPWTHPHRWIGVAICALLTGCTPCDLVFRTVRWEPSAFWWKSDRDRSRDTYRLWANQAWEQEGQGCAAAGSTTDYEAGFKDGFVDYVFAGGTGEPPPLPPRTFWNMDLRLPAGRERANQWFAGYRHGARVARESGYRSLAEVQTSLCESPTNDAYGPPRGGPPDQFEMQGPSWPQPEELPAQMPASTAPATGAAGPSPADAGAPQSPAVQPRPESVPPAVPPGQPVEELERSLRSAPAPEEIQLPSLHQRPSTPAKPAATPNQSLQQPGDSAVRSRLLRLTSNPQFAW
jgi:hypothetical protein